jgi:hypothetical protein
MNQHEQMIADGKYDDFEKLVLEGKATPGARRGDVSKV